MPTYVYACKDCGHGFEIYQSFDEDALNVCPQCQGTLRKQFNTVGVVFKGSGFYKTDSRSAGSEQTSSPAPAKTDTSSPSAAQN
ncbi:FmdB family zinc ribbon protein [Micrococcoides hystricis]|uniref:FmdB family zinc ribbon protein n=1 Tax=Micrococcoides hystricis TaxID=1572761 RepID=A0ABV6P9Y9_9MICC